MVMVILVGWSGGPGYRLSRWRFLPGRAFAVDKGGCSSAQVALHPVFFFAGNSTRRSRGFDANAAGSCTADLLRWLRGGGEISGGCSTAWGQATVVDRLSGRLR